jgi:hypothetical protein
MARTATLALSAVLIMPGARLLAGPVIDDPKFSFRLTLPDGFVPAPDKVRGDIIHAYTRPAGGGHPAIWVAVQRMGGTLPQGKLGPPPAGKPAVTVFTERWKRFDLEVVRLPESSDGVDYLTFNTQVPLAGEAIQLLVFGPATEEAELRAVTRALLDTLDGQSNWTSREDRIGKAMVGVVKLVGVVGVVVGLVLFGLWRNRVRRRALRRREDDERDPPRRPRRRRPTDPD